ncbi:MAG: hypothetical protein B6244_09215 [Candidatus Cloacimonetes bacterium 4572_55]|nr:MAG: hypothetical protein B6244_09215 [Candidatus Cloacimonetes bacterium 4572_55]
MTTRPPAHILLPAFNELHNDYRVFRTASALREIGFSVTVVGVEYPNSKPIAPWGKGIHMIRLGVGTTAGKMRYLSYNYQLAQLGKKMRCAGVHANDLDTLIGSGYIAIRQKIPLIYDSHELFIEQPPLVGRWKERMIWGLTERGMIRRADAVITVCDSIADQLVKRYRIPRPVVIRNMPPYRSIKRTNRIRERLGISDSLWIILYQGGLLQGLGLERIIRMGAYLRESVVVIVGGGPLETSLKQAVSKKNLDDRVKFIPHVPFQELAEYTASADVGLSLLEGCSLNNQYALPNKIFEYMMAGLPLVCSPFPEMAQIVNRYKTGILLSPGDPEMMAKEIENLLREKTRYQRYADNARKAARKLNWDQEKTRLIDLYRQKISTNFAERILPE